MLENVGQNIILPSYNELQVNVNALSVSVDSFIANINQENLVEVRAKYRAAYISWQKCDVFEFGPAEGLALRANLNVYPVNTSKIESNISAGNFNLDQLINSDTKGFPAIDYLLFGENVSDSALLVLYSSGINNTNRKNYLLALTLAIKGKVDEVVSSWNSYYPNFVANTSYSVGGSLSMLINAMNKYFERYVRDGKIGIPVGVKSLGIPLPKQVEAYYSGYSVDMLVASVTAFQNLYLGKYGSVNGLGLDDHLVAFDGVAIDQDMQSKLADALLACSALNGALSQTIINNQSSVEAVYSKLQKVVLPLKVDMPSKLGVLISYQDNDGD